MSLGYFSSLPLSVSFGLCLESIQLHSKRQVRLMGRARLILEGCDLGTSMVEIPLKPLFGLLQTRRL